MSLLHNIPPEVYLAYFKDFKNADPVREEVIVRAEDPRWDAGPVMRLSTLCVHSMAR